jgi:hypothetical protein
MAQAPRKLAQSSPVEPLLIYAAWGQKPGSFPQLIAALQVAILEARVAMAKFSLTILELNDALQPKGKS